MVFGVERHYGSAANDFVMCVPAGRAPSCGRIAFGTIGRNNKKFQVASFLKSLKSPLES